VFYLGADSEVGVAATKTFTSTLAVLLQLSGVMASGGNAYTQILGSGVPFLIDGILTNQKDKLRELGQIIANYKNVIFLGRGDNYPVAMEAALKLKEVSYIHAEAIHASEMKHGPIALIDENTLSVFLIGRRRPEFQRVLSNVAEITARGGLVLALVEQGQAINVKDATWTLEVPLVGDFFEPLVTAVYVQLLAYYAAIAKGFNPDRPRSLAKSVTVN
jgi:glucosamine--fructose-6-phosphate aminotransferase (isomerizing)